MHPLLDRNRRLVIAHRGNRVAAPENTLESFRQAAALGVDALELDVRMSRDGVPVVMHDPTIDRTTDRRGRVAQFTSLELRGVNAAARFAGRYPVMAVPLLEEIFVEFREIPLVVEVKEVAAAEATARMIQRFGAEGRVVVGSSRHDVMERFHGTAIPGCASSRDALRTLPAAILGGVPSRVPYDVLSITPRYYGVPIPILPLAAAAARAGKPTHVWTVNEPAFAIRLWTGGVAGIVTDDPAAMLRARLQ